MALKYTEKELDWLKCGSSYMLTFHHPVGIFFSLVPHTSCPRQTLMLHPSSVCVYVWRKWPFSLYLFLDVLKYTCTLNCIRLNRLRIFMILSVSKTMRQTTHIICGNGIIGLASQLLWNGRGDFWHGKLYSARKYIWCFHWYRINYL